MAGLNQEFIYEELDYCNKNELNQYNQLLQLYDYDLSSVPAQKAKPILNSLVQLTQQFPYFLPVYEDIIRLISSYESTAELDSIENEITKLWINACHDLVDKEHLQNRSVPWTWMENRPLLRGLYTDAEQKWEINEFEKANSIFQMLLKMCPNDNIGARYAEQATREKMSLATFNQRFVKNENGFTYYNTDNLESWFVGV